MALAPRTWLYLACLWLSIVTALGHAVFPTGSPLERGQGSAFSVSTTDVSLGLNRAGPAKIKRTLAPDDQGATTNFGPPLLAVGPTLTPPEPSRATPDPGPYIWLPPSSIAQGFDARGPPRA